MTDPELEPLVATQGGFYSYHAAAARLMVGENIQVYDCRTFGQVVRSARDENIGIGVIAISTAKGTVDRSAAELVRARPSALPTVVGKVNIKVPLVLIGSQPLAPDKFSALSKVHIYAQIEAWRQCEDNVRELFDKVKPHFVGESTQAIKNVVARGVIGQLAIGPRYAAEPLGGYILGPDQVNNPDDVTGFYLLKRNPNLDHLHQDQLPTQLKRCVMTLAHPEGDYEMHKVVELIQNMGIGVDKFITFAAGDFTKHRKDQKRAGGIFELFGGRHDTVILDCCSRINGLVGADGAPGPFSAKLLGAFERHDENWSPMDTDAFLDSYDGRPSYTQYKLSQPQLFDDVEYKAIRA